MKLTFAISTRQLWGGATRAACVEGAARVSNDDLLGHGQTLIGALTNLSCGTYQLQLGEPVFHFIFKCSRA